MRFIVAKDPKLSDADRAYLRYYIACHVSIHPETGCWVWTGTNDQRYGAARFRGKKYKAHRIAYLVFVGPIARHHVVDHDECNRGLCCNPMHLVAKTQSDNILRAYKVGRGRSPFSQKVKEDPEPPPF